MLKTRLPSPARRALGSGLFAIASVVVGFAAWAAEPAPATAPQAVGEAAAPTRAFMGKGILHFGPDAQIQTSANIVNSGPNGAQVLEGDVQITVIPPAGGGARHLVKVIKTPDGEQREESSGEAPSRMVLKAQKATVTPAPDGGVTIEFDHGSVMELTR
jgi:hypothetical protein